MNRNKHDMILQNLAVCCAMVVVAFSGCTHHSTQGPDNETRSTLSKKEVLEIAKEYVSSKEDWGSEAEFGNPRRKLGSDTWMISTWKRPLVPDGGNLIKMSSRGEIVSYGPIYSRP